MNKYFNCYELNVDDKKKNYSPRNNIVRIKHNLFNQSPGLYAAKKPLEPPFVMHLFILKHFLLSVSVKGILYLLGLLVQPNHAV